jgi:hypothetical protein
MAFRELLAQREGGESRALLHRIGRAHGGPGPPQEMDVIGLHGQFQNRPALLVTLLASQVIAALADHLMHRHLTPVRGAPDEVIDHQMDLVFIALVVRLPLLLPLLFLL